MAAGFDGGAFVPLAGSLANVSGQSSVYVRFRLVSNAADTDDGVHRDDVRVLCPALTYDGGDLEFLQGTSMAAPQVTDWSPARSCDGESDRAHPGADKQVRLKRRR